MRIEPKEIIHTLKTNGSVKQTAHALQIHRSTVYRWVKRARTYRNYLSTNRLQRRSTRPKIIHRVISPQTESAIITLRKKKGYAAIKLKYQLKLSISKSTIHRLLCKKQLLNKYGNHIRPRYQETTHMHAKNVITIGYLQMDVKYITPELSGLPYTCFEYAVVDIYSRYKEAVILNHLDQDGAMSALLTMLPKLPFTALFIQTDNGLEFLGRFHQLTQELKLPHHYIHKSTPNENALIERTFRTDEEEFFFRMERAPKDYDELRSWFATYLTDYNTYRPHLGIGLLTPYKRIQLSQMS